jgi:hypothetical protein
MPARITYKEETPDLKTRPEASATDPSEQELNKMAGGFVGPGTLPS